MSSDSTPRDESGDASTPARVDDSGVNTGLGYHLRLAQVAFQDLFDKAMPDEKLSQIQWTVLCLIGDNAGVSQIDLAPVIGVDRAGMMAIVDRLELRDLVVRRRTDDDRRRRALFLTESGQEMVRRYHEGHLRLQGELRKRYSDAEMDALISLLGKLRT
jgi:DNA-binding MarR family transcriptional regulator